MIKKLVKRGLRTIGYDLVRVQHHDTVHKPFYLLGFLIAEQIRLAKEDVTFVQVGAADGVLGDPLRPAILQHHLRGLLIEPVPSSFARLRKNYASEPQLQFANCAVASQSGTRTMYGFDPAAEASVHRATSLHAGNPTRRGVDTKRHNFEVPVRTLPDLLTAHKISNPTILVVDVEGLDAEVVCGALDAGYRPSIIMYEYVHLPRVTQDDCLKKLKNAGYSFVEADVDTYAVRDDLCIASGTIYT